MKKLVFFLILISLWGLIACNTNQKGDSESAPGYSTPEEQGISSRAIQSFVEALEETQPDAIHSLMLRRHGKIVAAGWWAPYKPDSPHLLWSLSKSFTSTAIGMAQDEGLLSIDDQVISFFPEDSPENPGNNLKAMRIRDLLKMSTGHMHEPSFRNMQGDNWVEAFLSHPVDFKPGTHFVYNSMATYMCSAILTKVTGKTMLEFLTPRLFQPLGIENPTWESDPRGINVGGWGLSVTTEDISKLGQLYLQQGSWEGKQLLSEEWVEEATGYQTSNGSNPESDWEQGYGYQFWQCRNNAYRGDGAFGQYCIVMPEKDAVLAITSGSDDMQGILNVVWEHLLPAMEEASLPGDSEGLEQLDRKLKSLSISTASGKQSSPLAGEISGKSYALESNDLGIQTISFDFEREVPEISLISGDGDYKVKAGYGETVKGMLADASGNSQKIAVSGAWEAENTFVVQVIFYETPQSARHTFTFEGNKLSWDTQNRASFGPRNLPTITGSTSALE